MAEGPKAARDLATEYLNGLDKVGQGYFDALSNRGDAKGAVRELDAFLNEHRPRPGEPEFRGFEWHYLWRLCHPDLAARPFPKLFDLVGHRGTVYFVTFSVDGKTIATAGQDHTARIWDGETGHLLQTLTGHTDDVNWIAFVPEALGPYVLTASDDKTVRIWNYRDGKQTGVLTGHQSKVVAVEMPTVFYANGERRDRTYEIVSGDDTGRIVFSDWLTHREVRDPGTHRSHSGHRTFAGTRLVDDGIQ